ncbi:MAG: hypothetical protein U0518_03295 [Candidatus Gracilibacteria bacterium]
MNSKNTVDISDGGSSDSDQGCKIPTKGGMNTEEYDLISENTSGSMFAAIPESPKDINEIINE